MPELDVLAALEFVALDRDALYSVVRTLETRDLVSAAGVSRALRFPVESVLRERTMERGYVHPAHIPPGFVTWISLFAWLEYNSLQLYDTHIPERQYALRRLGERLEPSVLAGYAPAAVRKFEDNYWGVRKDALGTLSKLDPGVIAKYAPAVVDKFDDNEWRVRLEALRTFSKLDPDVIAEYAPAVVDKLDDNDWTVRCAALETLGKLKPSVLNLYAIAIARQFGETAMYNAGLVRCAALETLFQLDASALEPYVHAVVSLLRDPYVYVRQRALWSLRDLKLKLNPELLLSVRATLVNMERDSDGAVRKTAALLLEKFKKLQN